MDRMWLGLAFAGLMALGNRGKPVLATLQEHAAGAQDSAAAAEARPPAPWLQGDPADSVYRAARAALDRRDYRQAAELFAQVPARFPRSGYAADAYYWRAFSLYRVGGTPQLRAALAALDTQRERFPKAATKGDAKALTSRIQGELARQGDPTATRQVIMDAADAGRTPPVPPSEISELPIPKELEAILMTCLEKDPAKRPASALDLDAQLTHVRVEQWTQNRARAWWETHVPDLAVRSPRV